MARDRWAVSAVAVLGLLAATEALADARTPLHLGGPVSRSAFARYFTPGSDEVLVSSFYRPSRRQRGDWEPIDLLLLVHNPEWEAAERAIVQRALTRVPVQVLLPERDRGAAEFRSWSRTRCVSLREAPLDTPWIRDYGPLQVFESGRVQWLDFGYYADRRLDDRLPETLAAGLRVRIENERPHVDGGGLISNGRGLCAMTDVSLADAGMHPAQRALLDRFAAELGCHGLAVLPALPDEQTGHADVVAQFLGPNLVAVAAMDPAQAPRDAELLDQSAGALRRTAAALGQALQVVRVPMLASGKIYYSYLNAIRVDDLLFVPEYREVPAELETEAHARLQAALPGVELVKVAADAMVPLGGALHCMALGLNLPEDATPSACGNCCERERHAAATPPRGKRNRSARR